MAQQNVRDERAEQSEDTCKFPGCGRAVIRGGGPGRPSGGQPPSGPAETIAAREKIDLKLSDSVTMKLVRIPAGRFWMGSPSGEVTRP